MFSHTLSADVYVDRRRHTHSFCVFHHLRISSNSNASNNRPIASTNFMRRINKFNFQNGSSLMISENCSWIIKNYFLLKARVKLTHSLRLLLMPTSDLWYKIMSKFYTNSKFGGPVYRHQSQSSDWWWKTWCFFKRKKLYTVRISLN